MLIGNKLICIDLEARVKFQLTKTNTHYRRDANIISYIQRMIDWDMIICIYNNNIHLCK